MNPYEVLNLTPDASDEEIENAYVRLKAQYSEDRFKEGEEGKLGAINLERLEKAYKDIKQEREQKRAQSQYGGVDYGNIDQLIRENRLEEAQTALNNAPVRTDRWHFLQSIIFYKKGWYQESRAQLKIAVNLAPDNKQYAEALGRLENVMASGTINPQTLGGGQFQPQQEPDDAMGLLNCCTTMCLLDCCCRSLTGCS